MAQNVGEQQAQPSSAPVMTQEQFMQGQALLKQYLKGISIKLEKGTGIAKVIFTYDFGDEMVAKAFAEGMKRQFEGGE